MPPVVKTHRRRGAVPDRTQDDTEVMSNDAQRLVEAVAPMWHPSTPVVTRFGGSRADDARTWLILPSVRQPILLVPPDNAGAEVALRPRGTGQGQLKMHVLAALQRARLLRFLPLHRLTVDLPSSGDSVHDVVAKALGEPTDIVVRLGRRGQRRSNRTTIVLFALARGGGLRGFVKVARGTPATAMLEREHANLVHVQRAQLRGLRAPAPLAYVTTEDLHYLVMTPLTSREVSRPRPVPVAQMQALADVGANGSGPLASRPLAQRLRHRAANLVDPVLRRWAWNAVEELLGQLGDVDLPDGAWHGDWVPWNMTRDQADVLLWDWEHFEVDSLRGFDHIHYLAQDLRVRLGTSPHVEERWLAEADAALAEEWGLDSRQRLAVVRAYLLEINLRFLEDREPAPGGRDRNGWGPGLIDRLARSRGGAVAR